jgi:hypothetical protein
MSGLFPPPTWQMTDFSRGRFYAFWSNDGHELFYETTDFRIMVVDYKSGGQFVRAWQTPAVVGTVSAGPGGDNRFRRYIRLFIQAREMTFSASAGSVVFHRCSWPHTNMSEQHSADEGYGAKRDRAALPPSGISVHRFFGVHRHLIENVRFNQLEPYRDERMRRDERPLSSWNQQE